MEVLVVSIEHELSIRGRKAADELAVVGVGRVDGPNLEIVIPEVQLVGSVARGMQLCVRVCDSARGDRHGTFVKDHLLESDTIAGIAEGVQSAQILDSDFELIID